MQRTLLFLVFIFSASTFKAQEKRPAVELSLTYFQVGDLSLKALIQPQVWETELRVILLEAKNIEAYMLRAGYREKLNFSYDGKELSFGFQTLPHPLAKIELKYSIDEQYLQSHPNWRFLTHGFVLNGARIIESAGPNLEPGFIFPCLSDSPHHWSLNLFIPNEWNYVSPWEEEFQVQSGKQTAHYFASAKAQRSSEIYLSAGAFEGSSARRIIAELSEILPSEEERVLKTLKENQAELLAFLATKRKAEWQDEELLELLNEAKGSEQLYLRYEMLAANRFSQSEFKLQQKLFLNSSKSVQEASQWQEDYYRQRLGADYLDTYLHKLFTAESTIDAHSWELYLNRYLAEVSLSLKDTSKLQDTNLRTSEREYLSTARVLWHKKAKLDFHLNYLYYYPQRAMRFILSQSDTSLLASLSIRALARGAEDSSTTELGFHLGLRDTLFWSLEGAPRSMDIELIRGKWPFYSLNETRPESYYLYDFSKSKNPFKKRRALLALLETKNPNLLATVMGIALDSGDPELQFLALAKTEKLNVIGKQKLASSIKSIAEESTDVKLKQKAAEALKIIAL